jgi:catalase
MTGAEYLMADRCDGVPGSAKDGIETADDSLIDLRDGSYAVSFSRRNP